MLLKKFILNDNVSSMIRKIFFLSVFLWDVLRLDPDLQWHRRQMWSFAKVVTEKQALAVHLIQRKSHFIRAWRESLEFDTVLRHNYRHRQIVHIYLFKVDSLGFWKIVFFFLKNVWDTLKCYYQEGKGYSYEINHVVLKKSSDKNVYDR